jgi:RNA polymerase sigma-70 factor (ECF subfamily)
MNSSDPIGEARGTTWGAPVTVPAQALASCSSRSSREQAAAIAAGCDELTLARVRAAGAGDRRAQRWLAEAVLADVRAIARSLSRDAPDADDACQFALLQILQAAARFRGEASVRHWSRRVATRAILKHRRRLQARRSREREFAPQLDSLTGAGPHEHLGEALPRSLREYLDELPAEQSEALVLKHALGYSVPEIAELSEVSPNTVKSRLRLGAKELRRRVRQETLTGAAPRERGGRR